MLALRSRPGVRMASRRAMSTGPAPCHHEQAMYCPRCHAALDPDDRRCWGCGRRLRPLGVPSALYTIVVVGLAGVLALGAVRLWSVAGDRGHRTTKRTTPPTSARPRPTTTRHVGTTVAATPQPVHPASVEASAQTGPAQNGCGQTTQYDAKNVLDGDPTTAWRTAGDGTGQTLRLALPGRTHLTSLGLIPGYAKVDACTASNRFIQMRKVTGVTWMFDKGASVTQTFVAEPRMQTMKVNVVTASVTLEITGTSQPRGLDFTPISDVAMEGFPA
jgi:hypothetical protein